MDKLLLALIAVSSNFVGNTLSCDVQNVFNKHMYIKHIIILYIIFFTIDTSDKIEEAIKKTLLIWLYYLALRKQSVNNFTLIIFLYTIINVIDKFKLNITNIKNNIQYIIQIVLVYGVLTSKDKSILGSVDC